MGLCLSVKCFISLCLQTRVSHVLRFVHFCVAGNKVYYIFEEQLDNFPFSGKWMACIFLECWIHSGQFHWLLLMGFL